MTKNNPITVCLIISYHDHKQLEDINPFTACRTISYHDQKPPTDINPIMVCLTISYHDQQQLEDINPRPEGFSGLVVKLGLSSAKPRVVCLGLKKEF